MQIILETPTSLNDVLCVEHDTSVTEKYPYCYSTASIEILKDTVEL